MAIVLVVIFNVGSYGFINIGKYFNLFTLSCPVIVFIFRYICILFCSYGIYIVYVGYRCCSKYPFGATRERLRIRLSRIRITFPTSNSVSKFLIG